MRVDGTIEMLRGDDVEALLGHLVRLDDVERRDRFGRLMSDGQLRDYAAGINLNRDIVIVVRRHGAIGGACHLSVSQDESLLPVGELGVSVDEGLRRGGWGRRLVLHALEVARRRRVVRVRLQFLRRDLAMGALVRGLGVQPKTGEGDEVEACVPLATADPAYRVGRRFVGHLEVFDATPKRCRARLVFVHGAGGDAWQWRQWLQPELARMGYGSTSLSLRNHGGSRHLGASSAQDYVDDVSRVLAGLDGEPILVGHSLGGYVAQRVAQQAPVRKLVLVSSIPPQPPEAVQLARMQQALDAPRARQVLQQALQAATPVDVAGVQAPVTVIAGSRDRVVPVRFVEQTARAYGVVPHRLERSGHLAMLGGQWKELARLCVA